MTDTPKPKTGRIFISYRRADSAGYAGRIYDRLATHFGKEAIFMDVDTIEAGLDFVDVLENAVQSCDVVVALLGRQWLNIKDESGERRLDNPQDFVRIEVATALKRNIRVIPVLVDGTSMPNSGQLPGNLKLLARRNAVLVNHHSFHNDVNRLIEQLELTLKAAEDSGIFKATGEIPKAVFQPQDTDEAWSDAEYNFLAQTALQAKKDQERSYLVFHLMIISVIVSLFLLTYFFDLEEFTQTIKLIVSGIFFLSTALGASTIITLGQLRKTWDETTLAMNRFRKSSTPVSNAIKKNSSVIQTIEIAITSGLMFGSSTFFFYTAFFTTTILTWLTCLTFGVITSIGLIKVYNRQINL